LSSPAPLHRWHAGEVTYEDFEPFKAVIRLSRFRLVKDKLDRSTEQRQS
jgi:hypothetical protein